MCELVNVTTATRQPSVQTVGYGRRVWDGDVQIGRLANDTPDFSKDGGWTPKVLKAMVQDDRIKSSAAEWQSLGITANKFSVVFPTLLIMQIGPNDGS